MKTYRVVIVGQAQKQWHNYYGRILEYCGRQPADNTQADFRATIVDLKRTAGSRPLYYEEPLAAAMGYRRINFVEGHHYFMLYRMVGDEAVIEYVAHFRRSVKKMMTKV